MNKNARGHLDLGHRVCLLSRRRLTGLFPGSIIFPGAEIGVGAAQVFGIEGGEPVRKRQLWPKFDKAAAQHRILLIADQFEETFTLVEDEALLYQFINVLLAGFPDPVARKISDRSFSASTTGSLR